jgi:hypothetical protein
MLFWGEMIGGYSRRTLALADAITACLLTEIRRTESKGRLSESKEEPMDSLACAKVPLSDPPAIRCAPQDSHCSLIIDRSRCWNDHSLKTHVKCLNARLSLRVLQCASILETDGRCLRSCQDELVSPGWAAVIESDHYSCRAPGSLADKPRLRTCRNVPLSRTHLDEFFSWLLVESFGSRSCLLQLAQRHQRLAFTNGWSSQNVQNQAIKWRARFSLDLPGSS